MNRVLLLLFLILISCNEVLAVSIPNSMKQVMKSTPDTPSLFNLVASLVVVILMIYFVGWIYMRLSHINSKSFFRQQKDLPVNKPKLVSGITLGQNRNLQVVELNNKYLVLGVTPSNINLIKEFDKNEVKNIEDALYEIVEDDSENILNKVDEANKKETSSSIEDICSKYL